MKTNHKLSALQILLAALCGVVLAIHRLRTGADGSSMLLVGCFSALILFLAARKLHAVREALSLKPLSADKFGFALLTLAGLLFIGAGILFFLLRDTSSKLAIITCVFSVFCGLVTLARLSLRDSGQTAAIYSLVPVFFLSFYLLLFYRSNGDNPNLSMFGFEVAVLLLALLGYYAAIAGRFEKERPRFCGFACTLGGSFITQELVYLLLNPGHLKAVPGFSLDAVAMLCAYGVLLCYALIYPPVREVFPLDEETSEKSESDA